MTQAVAWAIVMAGLVGGCATVLPKPEATVPAAPSPAGQEASARASASEQSRLVEQLTRIAAELGELQNAVARLVATSREHDGQLQALHRRVAELAAQTRDGLSGVPPGFAPSPRAPGPGVTGPDGGPAAALYQTGLARFHAGELDAAVLVLYELIANHPTDPLRESAQFLVADIFYAQKDFGAALAEFEGLLAVVPSGARTPDVLLKIGLCQRGLGDEARARRAWERVVREHPNSVAARQARVLLRGPRSG